MAEFVHICAQSELPSLNQVLEFSANGHVLCVANVGGVIAVLDGTCPHEGGPLGEGSIEDGKVVCPWHAFAFDVHTGAASDDPAMRAQVFEARMEDGELRAKL
jgi:nitrite reductase (NADH) small subunit